jgi:hypothetical protein
LICWKCGHLKEDHTYNKPTNSVPFYCWGCLKSPQHKPETTIHEFEDNLSYIERLAKEKELI